MYRLWYLYIPHAVFLLGHTPYFASEFLDGEIILCMMQKFLTIEQFRNPQLAAFQNRLVYADVLNFHIALTQYLIKEGILIDEDEEIMALDFWAPISIQIYRIHRNPECEKDAISMIERHSKHMCKMYYKQ